MSDPLQIPPAFIMIFGALLMPFVSGYLKNAISVIIPLFAFYVIAMMPDDASFGITLAGFGTLELLRADPLSKAFGYIFTFNAAVVMIYAAYVKNKIELTFILFYMGCALGVIFSGDLYTFYFYWELMALASTFVILSKRDAHSVKTGIRYLLVHLFGGLVLLAGIILMVHASKSFGFGPFGEDSFAAWLILVGILVNAAAPPFSAWLSDAYPRCSVAGGIVLSAYTTKTAVYALVRAYQGWDILVYVGCVMAIYGVIYAILENNMRRILAYSIVNQVGIMVCGVGIGTALSVNGAVAHAFCSVIYTSLLWMSAGAVLYRTGKRKCTDLGGLYRSMPWTMVLGLIGAMAISAVPLTNGFTSKTLIIKASSVDWEWAWFVLECASAGAFLYAGIKFPYFVFFGKDRGLKVPEAPKCMLAGMAIMASLCIYLGVNPQPLYDILPMTWVEEVKVYKVASVMTHLQLLAFSALAFFVFLPILKKTNTITLDTDWFYRKGGKLFYGTMDWLLNDLNAEVDKRTRSIIAFLARLSLIHWITGTCVRMINGFSAPGDPIVQCQEKEVQRMNKAGVYPIGASALAAIIVLALVLILW